MIVEIRLGVKIGLLRGIFHVADGVLEEHDGEDHVDHHGLSDAGAESWVVVNASQLSYIRILQTI